MIALCEAGSSIIALCEAGSSMTALCEAGSSMTALCEWAAAARLEVVPPLPPLLLLYERKQLGVRWGG